MSQKKSIGVVVVARERESFGESGESGDDFDAFESKEDFGDDDDPEEVEEEDAWKRRRKER